MVNKSATEQMEEALAKYQSMLDETIAKHEEVVAKANAELEAMVASATSRAVKKPAPKPEAQWTEANGNKLLVLNEAAAEFFSTIFQQMGIVAQELGKLANRKK